MLPGETTLGRIFRVLVLGSFEETKTKRRERFLLPNLPGCFREDPVEARILAGFRRVARVGTQGKEISSRIHITGLPAPNLQGCGSFMLPAF